jgi:glutamate N-acetyltransferase/amino-acid N-acetyltransferase
MAQAIMTTDPFSKEHAVTVKTARGTFTVGGTAKGSGMIEPNMATMLGFLATDAQVSPAVLQRALRESADDTFNAITVDGECSTNDCVFAMASGRSGVEIDDELYPALVAGFYAVSRQLAVAIVRGGEGATKLITIAVTDAHSVADARRVAKTIANSPLVKTAVHGADPNWGRVAMAIGKCYGTDDSDIDPEAVVIRFGEREVYPARLDDDHLAELSGYLRQREVLIHVTLDTGSESCAVWGCDLTAGYVRINADYTT